ncbi:hypothetical protein [Aureimonas psammosilenae]|nr:hypothetical protein [Aureimonas psammosilenae]
MSMEPITDWKPVRFLPFIEWRFMAVYGDDRDVYGFLHKQYRLRPRGV